MAGLGFKDFAVGEVLTAADVDGYLMQQSVMRFADSAARGSALGTAVGTGVVLAEGMVAYLDDVNQVEVYNGTIWRPVSTIRQVVSAVKTDTYSVSLGLGAVDTVNVTGLEATITPSDATNKVMVHVAVNLSLSNTGGAAGFVLYRGATAIAVGDAASSRTRITAEGANHSAQTMATVGYTFLDSPGTTSATTYGIRLFNSVSGTATAYVNRTPTDSNSAEYGRGASTITTIEVA